MISIQAHNTFGIDVESKDFIVFDNAKTLAESIQDLKRKNEKYLILGGGSNVLFTENFDGTILKNAIKGIEILSEDSTSVVIESGGGEVWHELVLWAIEHNFGGIENMSLIPGSVGAAPMQNIGAYGTEIKDVFVSLSAFEIETGAIKSFNLKECEFGYRESVFKRKLKDEYVILSVQFILTKKGFHKINTSYGLIESELQDQQITAPTIKDVSNAVIKIRQSKLPDPREIGNSGSFFKNPILPIETIEKLKLKFPDLPVYPVDADRGKTAAGWLIDQAGWKGFTDGNYGVHKKQALVLVNYGGAKGKDIYALSQKIIDSIKEKFGIELEREVNIY